MIENGTSIVEKNFKFKDKNIKDIFAELGDERLCRLFSIEDKKTNEKSVVGTFLSTLSAIQEFKVHFFNYLGIKIKKSDKLYAFSEVHFSYMEDNFETKTDSYLDGILILTNSKGDIKESFIVESKLAKNDFENNTQKGKINLANLKVYSDIAKNHGFSKIITISSQTTISPDILPYDLDLSKTSLEKILHISWFKILTIAHMLYENNDENIEDEDQQYIMKEFIRYLIHKNTKVINIIKSFDEKLVKDSLILMKKYTLKNSKILQNTIISEWLNKQKEIILELTKKHNEHFKICTMDPHELSLKLYETKKLYSVIEVQKNKIELVYDLETLKQGTISYKVKIDKIDYETFLKNSNIIKYIKNLFKKKLFEDIYNYKNLSIKLIFKGSKTNFNSYSISQFEKDINNNNILNKNLNELRYIEFFETNNNIKLDKLNSMYSTFYNNLIKKLN